MSEQRNQQLTNDLQSTKARLKVQEIMRQSILEEVQRAHDEQLDGKAKALPDIDDEAAEDI